MGRDHCCRLFQIASIRTGNGNDHPQRTVTELHNDVHEHMSPTELAHRRQLRRNAAEGHRRLAARAPIAGAPVTDAVGGQEVARPCVAPATERLTSLILEQLAQVRPCTAAHGPCAAAPWRGSIIKHILPGQGRKTLNFTCQIAGYANLEESETAPVGSGSGSGSVLPLSDCSAALTSPPS